jgi:hypothetical protein
MIPQQLIGPVTDSLRVAKSRGSSRHFRPGSIIIRFIPPAIDDEKDIALVDQLAGDKPDLGDVSGNPWSKFHGIDGVDPGGHGQVIGNLAALAGRHCHGGGWGCGGDWLLMRIAGGQAKKR